MDRKKAMEILDNLGTLEAVLYEKQLKVYRFMQEIFMDKKVLHGEKFTFRDMIDNPEPLPDGLKETEKILLKSGFIRSSMPIETTKDWANYMVAMACHKFRPRGVPCDIDRLKEKVLAFLD